MDIWMATYKTTQQEFGSPVDLQDINTSALEVPAAVSGDGCRLRSSTGGGTSAILVASRRR
jgi:hypothetical protein